MGCPMSRWRAAPAYGMVSPASEQDAFTGEVTVKIVGIREGAQLQAVKLLKQLLDRPLMEVKRLTDQIIAGTPFTLFDRVERGPNNNWLEEPVLRDATFLKIETIRHRYGGNTPEPPKGPFYIVIADVQQDTLIRVEEAQDYEYAEVFCRGFEAGIFAQELALLARSITDAAKAIPANYCAFVLPNDDHEVKDFVPLALASAKKRIAELQG